MSLVELEIPPRRDHLALVRLVVETTARLMGLPDERVDDLRLAVSEGCTNALDAHAERDEVRPISVTIRGDDAAVTVAVSDHAGGFEPGAARSAPSVTDPERLRHERGLGIPIMRSLVDEVGYEETDDGTRLVLVVRRPPAR